MSLIDSSDPPAVMVEAFLSELDDRIAGRNGSATPSQIADLVEAREILAPRMRAAPESWAAELVTILERLENT